MLSFYKPSLFRRSDIFDTFFTRANDIFFDPFEELVEPRILLIKRSENKDKKDEKKSKSLEIPQKMVENLEKEKKENVNNENVQQNTEVKETKEEKIENVPQKNEEEKNVKIQKEDSKKQVFNFTPFHVKGSLLENEEAYTFNGTVPKEISKEDLVIEVKEVNGKNLLVIQAEKKDENGVRSFKRQFLLDRNVNIDSIKAKLTENHQLSIEIPKLKQTVKRITIE